jgi:hypothetical protein
MEVVWVPDDEISLSTRNAYQKHIPEFHMQMDKTKQTT